jgi:trans-aconitate methyltransferase
MHHLFKLLTGGDLLRAPIRDSNPRRVLDIGTGTGEWVLEMAEDYPHADIIGTDLSPIQPNWAPPNCRFFIDDAESDWTFSPHEKFDYIHARSMGGGIGDWPKLLKQAYQHLKPGGWFEAQEFEALVHSDDGTHEHATSLLGWQDLLHQASNKFGKPINVSAKILEWMRIQGFANVTDDIYKVRELELT